MTREMIEQRHIGGSDILVSRLGLGCVTFGREIDEAESFRLLDQARDGGITLLDTARLRRRQRAVVPAENFGRGGCA